MFKTIKNKLACLAAAVMSAVMLLSPISAYAEYEPQPGSIEITLKDLGTTNYTLSKVTASLYRVGDTDIYGRAAIYEQYGGGEVPESAAKTQELISFMEENLQSEDFVTSAVGDMGTIFFEDVDMGLYLITFTTTEKYGEVTPVLINLPYWENDDGRVTGPYWDAKTEPKSEIYSPAHGSSGSGGGSTTTTTTTPNTSTYKDTPGTMNTPGVINTGKPSGPDVTTGEADSITGSPTTPDDVADGNGDGTSIVPGNTGEETPAWVWALVGLAIVLAAAIIMLGRKKHEN